MYMIKYKIRSYDKQKVWQAGPYTTYDNAEMHRIDIAGHKGVSDCAIVELDSNEDRQAER